MFNKPPDLPAPCWILYVRVPDVAAAASQVTAMGGTVLSGPMEMPGGALVAQCTAPQGTLFAIHQTAPS
jgi:predicted enzyme related to lactoylglutathione lyase